jgi:acetyl-CoA C-acetyltransferase
VAVEESLTSRTRAAVIGTAIWSDIRTDEKSLEELIHDVTREALKDASIRFEDIDGIVVAGNDQYDGRAITVMAASGSVGGVDRDILSTPSASEHAFVMGALRVQSGHFSTQLVVAWSPLECDSLAEVQRLAADPYFHRSLPLDELSAHALQASVLESRQPEVARLARAIVKKNRGRCRACAGTGRLLRWPLTDHLVAPATFGIAAMVLASEEFVTRKGAPKPAWIEGMGWATEPTFMGDRDLGEVEALVHARQRAYRQAGITNALEEFDVAELADATPHQELLAYEGLGLADRKSWVSAVEGGIFSEGGSLPVNLSGGAQCSNPVFCAGLRSIAGVVDQIRGRAGAHQKRDARRGLAHAASGFAMQYQTVIVIGSAESGALT